MEKYNCVFFDFDGTLADTIPGITVACNNISKKYNLGLIFNDEICTKCIGDGSKVLFLKAFKYQQIDDSNIHIYDDFINEYQRVQIDHLKIYDGVIETLKKLKKKKIKLFIYSNKPEHILFDCVDKYFKEIKFDGVYGNNSEFPPKPNPCFLLKTMQNFNILNNEAIYIGDSIVDLNTAKNVNIDSLILTYGYGDYLDISKNNPTYMSNHFENIIQLF